MCAEKRRTTENIHEMQREGGGRWVCERHSEVIPLPTFICNALIVDSKKVYLFVRCV